MSTPKVPPILRLDGRNVLRCAAPRERGYGVDCDTPIARPTADSLVVRCRNCHADHVFRAVNDEIVWEGPAPQTCRLPEGRRVS